MYLRVTVITLLLLPGTTDKAVLGLTAEREGLH